MARMYPRELPRHVLENPKLSSEVRVYERMRDKLPGDYNCYYSRSWHEADRDGVEFDGEADFIVAHAEHGLLFLEVKGGRVSCREADGQWLSEDRDGFKFRIKNPLSQARSSKHHYLKRLNASRALSGRFVRARHGAILPGSARPRRALAPDAPLEIIAFGDDMEMALARVSERVAQLLGSGQVLPGQIAILVGGGSTSMSLPDKIAGKPTCRSDDVKSDHIVLDTVRRFKGLSRPCVFLVGLEGLTDPELIYVATSRANVLLEIVGTAEDIARIKQEVEATGR